MRKLQIKQLELDNYIIESKNIKLSKNELLKNMILACHDEILEAEEAPDDVMEYIDILHFVLSIANKFNIVLPDMDYFDLITRPRSGFDYIESLRSNLLFITRESRIFKHWSVKEPTDEAYREIKLLLIEMCVDIVKVCQNLDADVVVVYNKKYEINKQRQRENY